MKYVVNGVEYTDLKEAEKAEKAFEEAKKKKEALVEVKRERIAEIKEAFADLRSIETKAGNTYTEEANKLYKQYRVDLAKLKADYSAAIEEAQKKYDELKNSFIEDYGSFHLTYLNNGDDQEISVSDIVNKMFNLFTY